MIRFHFSSQDGQERRVLAEVRDADGNPLLNLTFGPASELWRINRRWRRSNVTGYTLDLSRGIWNRRQGDTEDTALDSGVDQNQTGVQIFVRDSRNILLIRPPVAHPLSAEELANLQHALQKGLCAEFQIEETEIDSERIGQGEQASILFYEAAEGGVGVLQRLVEEPDALSRMARQALEVCHFDPATGNDLPGNIECVRACYNCLLTYRNQRDHGLLNRHQIKALLLQIAQGTTRRGYASRTYDAHYEWLRQQTDSRSRLEKDLLDHLYREGRRLPDEAQKRLPDYPSRRLPWRTSGTSSPHGSCGTPPGCSSGTGRVRSGLWGICPSGPGPISSSPC